MSSITAKQKLKAIADPVVRQIVFDALHRRRSKYSAADNAGQHADYREIVEDMEKEYKSKVVPEPNTEEEYIDQATTAWLEKDMI